MQKFAGKIILLLLFTLFGLNNANAQSEFQTNPVSEVRLGVMAHSVDRPGPNNEPLNFTRIENISFEVLFRSPEIDAFKWIGSPRINLGTTINTNGRESKIHLGLTWKVQIFETPLFIEGTFGAAVHNGALNGVSEPARNLGSRFLFYEAAGIGMDINDNMNIILFAEHASNANIAQPNEGISNIGVKMGFVF